ncbi:helix-turn-helix domain-containing protein [Symbioplanes lichenis]|uniref:helix-turn-helix domain-containing protein n=1 Tax=Symbioplanes lichenis TaxID=1629072 RepID=UPI00273A2325|nr:helix-turn-helix transcriptional regulator [Actinoplanes lichenis]
MYAERGTRLPHVLAWHSVVEPDAQPSRILPDGCMDVIWHEGHVFVAGADTTAQSGGPMAPVGSRYFAVRFAAGTGPGVLGLPADELTDRQVPLDALVPAAESRRIAGAGDPLAALMAFVTRRWQPPDETMVTVHRAARSGLPVAAIADVCGLSLRQLQRRVTAAYGYGPKTLARILRLQRALPAARGGRPFAEVAVAAGYADQAHLSREVKALAGVSLGDLVRGPG